MAESTADEMRRPDDRTATDRAETALAAADTNRRLRLRNRPGDVIDESTFELVEEAVPEVGPGQALIRNRVFSIDPSNRLWVRSQASYMPRVEIGDVMRAIGIGEVIASEHERFKPGALVSGFIGFQDYALIGEGQNGFAAQGQDGLVAPLNQRLGVSIEDVAGLFLTGLTAYFGIEDIGKPQPGETVFVSAAAGATGSMAGQIAKRRDARVVGIAGGKEKCDWLVEELGFDVAIDRHADDWEAQLERACPDGIDVDFENVGGPIMEAVFERLNLHSRIALCGMISGYNQDRMGAGPRNFELAIHRRVMIQGFLLSDYFARWSEGMKTLATWLAQGEIKQRLHVLEGLAHAHEAMNTLFTGDHVGKVLLRVADDRLQSL